MKLQWRHLLTLLLLAVGTTTRAQYTPTPENLEARRQFEGFRFGIFLHWGIYSEYAQGEWYLNSGLDNAEYSKAASCFYPICFNAQEWVEAIKGSGARYITFTSRHHDGFSMWHTSQSPYNIVDATPFKRDVLRELADACHEQGITLNLYYSILDWIRPDYPLGRTGLNTGRTLQPNYDSYFNFMKAQLTELLTGYGPIGALWFDGYWDHDSDAMPFDWRMPQLYTYLHQLRPACLIGNNHHLMPLEGEDFQMFERDLPGENTAGLSGQDISQLPLEMCQTMNGMWGYKVADTNYKSAPELITLLVRAAAKGSNLLLNIGPQPNGELPHQALDRLQGIGQWMQQYAPTIRNTRRGPVADDCPWGVSTQTTDGSTVFLHVLEPSACHIDLELQRRPRRVIDFVTRQPLATRYDRRHHTLTVELPDHAQQVDYVVELRP